MKINVRFYGVVYVNTGIRDWHPELNTGARVIDLFKKMVEQYTRLSNLVYDENGKPIEYLSISVNNVDILGLKGFETELHEADTVFVMPPIGGG